MATSNDTWRLNRPMASTSNFGVGPTQGDHHRPPSFIRVKSPPPPLLRSIGFKDAFHRPLFREYCHSIPFAKGSYTEIGTEVVPFSLIDDRLIIRSVCERTPSKLSTYNILLSTYNILGPGMIILENYVSISDQVDIVKLCEKWAAGPGGFYIYESDADRRRQTCFGRNWEPETRYEIPYRSNGFKPPPVPYELISLAKATIQDAQILLDELPSMCPDTCLVSFYQSMCRVGLHQDCDESSVLSKEDCLWLPFPLALLQYLNMAILEIKKS